MEFLEKIVKKAVKQKKHLKYPALVLSGIAGWIAGTYEEGKANKETLTDEENEFVGEKDYMLYQSGMTMTMLGHCYLLWTMPPGKSSVVYVIAADGLTRASNLLTHELKRVRSGQKGEFKIYEGVGLIGTLRTIGYKLADRLKRGESEAESELELAENTGDSES